ncbi:MAG: nickel-binding protein [Kiloniellaceae bacterium]
MRRYIVERVMPGIGAAGRRELQAVAARDEAAVKRLDCEVLWVKSFIAQDKTYCLYLAKDEDSVRRHSALAGFATDKVTEVRRVIDPTTAEA